MTEPRAMTARDRTTIRVLTAAAFVVILNETIMTNAIPVLITVLDIDARAAQWLSTGFMLTMAVVIPTTGWLLERLGVRRAFALAMGLFCAGTLFAALAPTFPFLLAARVVQASGTAIMMPLLMSTVLTLVPPSERGRMMGNVSLAISVAPALGPALSGVILQFASWRWLFGIVLPIAAGIAIVGLRLLTLSERGRVERLDAISVVLTAVGFGGLVYGLSLFGEGAGHGPSPLLVFGIGVVGVALFVLRQLRLVRIGGDPLLDLRVLRDRGYVVAVSLMAVAFMALMGVMILLPMYLQGVRGESTLQAGLVLMPGALLMGFLGPRVGRLYDRLGARRLVLPGALVLCAALWGMTAATIGAPWWAFLALHVVASVGLAFIFTPVFTSGLASLPSHLYGHGSALLGTLQQVAAGAGTALVITVMSSRAASLEAAGQATVPALAVGVQWGFAVGALLTVIVVALAPFMRTPAVSETREPIAVH
ncbi:MDR family MFS transporter [Agilicoccus flavus]|uniref:MDR family MFS transporter n=1 Tax=Agilicoccus flavus TaxID=2775968 RepID=UPI001CF6F800|nr:MDR family MFS transporter [Agilicoccus flavus]